MNDSASLPSEIRPKSEKTVQVLIADSGPLQSELLARALKVRRDFKVAAVNLNTSALHNYLLSNDADVVLMAGSNWTDLSVIRWLRISHPNAAPVLLAESDEREFVINALRSGARGIFRFADAPFRMLCKCIHCVAGGEIWLSHQQMQYALDALSEVPTLRVVSATGRALLTPREEQVVALVAEGLSNRDVAGELQLSEHTIKKYLLRIFDKLGISSRVELVLYAMSNSENRPAEWLPGIA